MHLDRQFCLPAHPASHWKSGPKWTEMVTHPPVSYLSVWRQQSKSSKRRRRDGTSSSFFWASINSQRGSVTSPPPWMGRAWAQRSHSGAVSQQPTGEFRFALHREPEVRGSLLPCNLRLAAPVAQMRRVPGGLGQAVLPWKDHHSWGSLATLSRSI